MNKAAELGPRTFDWWKDWRGECVAIIASGVSTKQVNLSLLRDRIHVLAIKQNYDLCPWADVVYGCDWPWWHYREGLPAFKGLKLAYAYDALERYKDLRRITIENASCSDLLLDVPASIGAGGNSGFQAINIAVQFGATGILLIGYDMHDRSGVHWYGRNLWNGANNPDNMNFRHWTAGFNKIAPRLQELGIDVVNASTISTLQCFRKASIDEAFAQWGL